MAVPGRHTVWGVIQGVVNWLLPQLGLSKVILSCNIPKLFTMLQWRILWGEYNWPQQQADSALYEFAKRCEIHELP